MDDRVSNTIQFLKSVTKKKDLNVLTLEVFFSAHVLSYLVNSF